MTVVEDDFAGYVGARWPALVRTMVLLGCPIELAPDVVTAGLARCRRGWRETAEHDDLEVVVHRAVLEAWQERQGESWWHGLRPPDDAGWPAPDLGVLDRLTPDVRAGLVFRRFSALDPAQAVAIAGKDAGGPLPAAPDGPALLAAADMVVVYAPPEDADLVQVGAVRRRRRMLPVVGLLLVALVLGGGTWWANRSGTDRDDADALEPVEPRRADNVSDVAWYAEGTLHLSNAVYRLPDLRQFSVLGAGAVYTDARGRIVHLLDDGRRVRIGSTQPGSPVVASDELGQVAWVEGPAAAPRLVVHDVSQGDVVGELALPPSATPSDVAVDTRAVAFDGDRLYYMTANGWGAWLPGEAEPVEVGDDQLYDVATMNRLSQVTRDTISLDPPVFTNVYEVPGRGGELSADGDYAVTRDPATGSVLVYDARSGEGIDVPDLRLSGDMVVDVVLTSDQSLSFISVDPDGFEQPAGSDATPRQGYLFTCQLGRVDAVECEELASFVVRTEGPVLAR